MLSWNALAEERRQPKRTRQGDENVFQQRAAQRFIGEFVGLLDEGVGIPDALELLAVKQRSKRWKSLVLGIRAGLLQGDPLSMVIQSRKVFPKHYSETIAWGERSGYAEDLYRSLRVLAGDTSARPKHGVSAAGSGMR